MSEGAARADVVASFRQQATGCRTTGSSFYAALLERAADDLEQGGPLARLVAACDGEHPLLDNLPLRVMGAIHAEVLAGRAPGLAAFYPSAGGQVEPDGAWDALHALVASHAVGLATRLYPVQTNEVRRCCALLPGFLSIAAATGLPLRLLEIGSSGGLNLNLDRYAYQLGPHAFGPNPAPLSLDCEWRGEAPPSRATLRVASRLGCDPTPLDLRDGEMRTRLESFVWPEQTERFGRLRAAMQVAAESPPEIVRSTGAPFLGEQLSTLVPGQANVVFHSVVWWYVPKPEQDEITRLIEAAGEGATAERPLAWLRMEGASLDHAELRLRSWPSGEDVHLADCHWHGAWVDWKGAR